GATPRLFGESRFLLDPAALGRSPEEEEAPFTEGHSHFRTSGGTAAGKTKFKNLNYALDRCFHLG
ncbi:MAG: hypothetical protein L0287_30105, partial [Anaerolineae bacterium]|nr:hypothetical protein [Anaerolineae bacterium]